MKEEVLAIEPWPLNIDDWPLNILLTRQLIVNGLFVGNSDTLNKERVCAKIAHTLMFCIYEKVLQDGLSSEVIVHDWCGFHA